jgi:hypothetical protein
VVPVVVHPRHRHHGREEQRHGDDAELGDVASPVERLDLAGQVPRQEAQPGERPCNANEASAQCWTECRKRRWPPELLSDGCDLHEVWPLGKLLYPSLITPGSPWQMTSLVTLSYL